MADILIKGLALPKEVQCCYTIYPNGHVIYHWDGKVFGEATAIELPSHGRLKDESVIIENMGNAFDKLFPLDGKHKQTIVSDCHVEFMRAVFNAPVVVEASTEVEASK